MKLVHRGLIALTAFAAATIFGVGLTKAASPYEAAVTSQSPYVTLSAGQEANFTVTVKNTGTSAWQNFGANPVNLAVADPVTRTSHFQGSGWISTDRPTRMTVSSVQPNESATFTFNVKVPAGTTPGVYREHFTLVSEHYTFFSSPDIWWDITVPAAYRGEMTAMSPYPTLRPGGASANMTVRVKNTGSSAWQNFGSNPVSLALSEPVTRRSDFIGDGWVSADRPARLQEQSVQPGETGTFTFALKAKSGAAAGTYREHFNLVAENYSFFSDDTDMFWDVTVPAAYQAQMTLQSPYVTLNKGSTATVIVKFKNTGWSAWQNYGDHPVRLALSNPTSRNSLFFPGANWVATNRPVTLSESSVQPDETGTFTFTIAAPSDIATGTYQEYFNLVAENFTFFPDSSQIMWQVTIN